VNLTVFRDSNTNSVMKEHYITATYPEVVISLDPNQTTGSLVVNKYYAETDPETGKFLAEFNAFPTNLTDGYTKFYWDFDDGKKDETRDSATTHSYKPGIYQPCVKVHNDGVPDQVLHLPTLLIVVSPGMSIDDIAEDEVA
jgi:PKD repeat protein